MLDSKSLDLAITKERMRADRHRVVFSVIVLQISSSSESDKRLKSDRVSSVLASRLRLTDERGFRQNGDIGILLPHTHGVGARVVLDSVLELADQAGVRFDTCRVYVYPTPVTEVNEEDDSNDSEFDGILSGQNYNSSDRISNEHESLALHRSYIEMAGQDGDISDLIAPSYPIWKRASDVLLASIGLILSLPILLIAAMAIKLTSRGPVFFHQFRTGRLGRPFRIMKLRTMVVDAEELKAKLREMNERDGPAFKMKYDPRVTRVGKFLRSTGLDELPQLWNVLKGDMAIVGPRPLPCDEDANCEAWHRHRLETKPGITCFWQIMKSRVEEFDDWMRLDLKYLSNRSLVQDVRLMAKTVMAVILGRVGH